MDSKSEQWTIEEGLREIRDARREMAAEFEYSFGQLQALSEELVARALQLEECGPPVPTVQNETFSQLRRLLETVRQDPQAEGLAEALDMLSDQLDRWHGEAADAERLERLQRENARLEAENERMRKLFNRLLQRMRKQQRLLREAEALDAELALLGEEEMDVEGEISDHL